MATRLREPRTEFRPLSVDEVIRMAEAGIIGERERVERVELVDGSLVRMSPESEEHAKVASVVGSRLAIAYLGSGPRTYEIRSKSTLPLGEHSYLEPDVLVLRPADGALRWPAPEEVMLVVEVSRTSARRDRTQRARLYAAWGAPTYWVVDLKAGEIVVHEEPGPQGYARVGALSAGEVGLPGLDARLPVTELLPPY